MTQSRGTAAAGSLGDGRRHNGRLRGARAVGEHTGEFQRSTTASGPENRRLSFVCKPGEELGAAAAAAAANRRPNQSTKSGRQHQPSGAWNEMEYSERQNSVRALDLFRYARFRELAAVGAGIAFMIYAASWQPISVFILAIMASLMGQYSKQTHWLKQLNHTSPGQGAGEVDAAAAAAESEAAAARQQQQQPLQLQSSNDNQVVINGSSSALSAAAAATTGELSNILARSFNYLPAQLGQLEEPLAVADGPTTPALASYEDYSILGALHSFVTPIFDLGTHFDLERGRTEQAHIRTAVHDILEHESRQFLRKSFEINGSAFLLALTQLLAFFLGLSLITWAAKKQASRIKLLYFNSCLYQEVTWFEAIDSASGSGSSLNGLVNKYQDGIGMKLALLCYFLGHVGLFAITAFYQMFSLAAFCMPFVLMVGLVIGLLSDWQANSMGQQALFAKRSLQLAEEIVAAMRTVFAFNGQQKEITRYSLSLEPVYRKSLVKHLYTALNTSLSKFSIFACFAVYCFYARRLFAPYSERASSDNKATILAVMRGAEVSIVNILISIPFLEALQQSKGSIARIFVAIERQSRISAASELGIRLDSAGQLASELEGKGKGKGEGEGKGKGKGKAEVKAEARGEKEGARQLGQSSWPASISFRGVSFDYADRSGPTRRRSTLPFLNLAGSTFLEGYSYANGSGLAPQTTSNNNDQHHHLHQQTAAAATAATAAGPATACAGNNIIEQIADEALDAAQAGPPRRQSGRAQAPTSAAGPGAAHSKRRQSALIRNIMGGEICERRANAQRQILNCFNLDIEPGQSVALVGPSGAGKSTVLALVQRLYEVTGGQLLVGQRDVRQLNLGWLRNQIGLVGQEPQLFDMSIAENIMLGLSRHEFDRLTSAAGGGGGSATMRREAAPSAKAAGLAGFEERAGALQDGDNGSDDHVAAAAAAAADKAEASRQLMQQVVAAAKAANAHEFITRLPSGYATRAGSRGLQLSGGQKQRIAIARALIRRPKILLLDECTSALDSESEALVHAALKSASAGRTTLIVAHRLATIRHVDLIVVMNQGQVVASGTHEQLMEAAEAAPLDNEIGPGARLYKQLYEEEEAAAASKRPDAAAAAAAAAASTRARVHDEVGQPRGRGERISSGEIAWAENGAHKLENGSFSSASSSSSSLNSSSDSEPDECGQGGDSSAASSAPKAKGTTAEKPTIWQLWQFVEMPRWSALAAVLVCLLAGLILPLNLIAHSYLFSAFAYSELAQIGDSLHLFGLLMLSFSAFVLIVSFLQVILPGYVGEKLSVRLRVKTMDALLRKPMFYFDMDSNSVGALCDRFNGYIGHLQSLAGARLATMLEAMSTLTAAAIFGLGQNLALSLFCLSFALMVLITTIIESRIVERETGHQQECDAQLAQLMADALSNIKTIAALNQERYFIRKFGAILKRRERGAGWPWLWLHNFLTSLKFVMPAMSWSASMFYGSYLLACERIDLQTIYIVCPVVLFAVNDTFRALVFLPELLRARKSLERLYKLNREFSPQLLQGLTLAQQLEAQNRLHLQQLEPAASTYGAPLSGAPPAGAASGPPADKQGGISFEFERADDEAAPANRRLGLSPHQQQQAGVNRRLSNLSELPTYMRRKSSRLNSLVPRSSARGRIDFKGVHFAYPNRPAALVLEDFSLSVAPGESVALVGGSGSGKSTAVNILEKFYDYHAGHVTLDGRDLRLVEPTWVRSQIGLVQQEPCLLSYTIGDNIRYGDNGRFVSMDEVVAAARTANIHHFIMTLPDQYDTELSSSAYSSCQLSGGQRQRIAIARALIRNAPILIFDEATSALDNKSEQVVQDALDKAKRGRTSLTIAHRLATIREADKIVVLREGRLVEQGRHEELIARPNGFYRSLWERQGGEREVSGFV